MVLSQLFVSSLQQHQQNKIHVNIIHLSSSNCVGVSRLRPLQGRTVRECWKARTCFCYVTGPELCRALKKVPVLGFEAVLVSDFFVWLKMSEKKKVDVILLITLLFLV